MIVTDIEIIASEGMAVRRRGSVDFGSRITLLPGESADAFEEIDADTAHAEYAAVNPDEFNHDELCATSPSAN